jgi:putative transposase
VDGGARTASMSIVQTIWCYVLIVAMPNHFHGIVYISPDSTDNPTLGEIIGAFKSIVPVRYITGVKTQDWTPFDKRLWHRNYDEHIVRDDSVLQQVQQYIRDNSLTWKIDSLHLSVQIQSCR